MDQPHIPQNKPNSKTLELIDRYGATLIFEYPSQVEPDHCLIIVQGYEVIVISNERLSDFKDYFGKQKIDLLIAKTARIRGISKFLYFLDEDENILEDEDEDEDEDIYDEGTDDD